MMKELKIDEPFELAAGCPTITFNLAEESLMLPWSSFTSGSFKDGRIGLIFQDWKIEIEGDELEEVWKLVQMQDLRVLGISRGNPESQKQGCRIRKISALLISKCETGGMNPLQHEV